MKKMADIMSKTGKWLLVFGFILSQLSFPLEVLAEELNNAESTNTVVEETTEVEMTNTTEEITPDDDIQTEEVAIKVNGVETSEYSTTEENAFVAISLEYQDEIKNKGPLSGIMTGLKHINSQYALVLPFFLKNQNR